jgi:hypothetical protein
MNNAEWHLAAMADELKTVYISTLSRGHGVVTREVQGERASKEILELGYSKPRKVTLRAELDAMGFGSAVLDNNGAVWVNDGDSLDRWASLAENTQGGPIWRMSIDIELPAKVLREGRTA